VVPSGRLPLVSASSRSSKCGLHRWGWSTWVPRLRPRGRSARGASGGVGAAGAGDGGSKGTSDEAMRLTTRVARGGRSAQQLDQLDLWMPTTMEKGTDQLKSAKVKRRFRSQVHGRACVQL